MSSEEKKTVITIDGPAGAGKSTAAKSLAKRLQFFYLDTGAMYRALTLKALRNNLNLEDESALVALANQTSIDFKVTPEEEVRVLLDGEDVSQDVRTTEVTNNTALIACKQGVRTIMVGWQRAMSQRYNVVIEGRDVGTVVFPQATCKFYLEADLNERANRRLKELEESGAAVEADELKEQIHSRDESDKGRSAGPLKKADDAVVIDSTKLSADEVVEAMFNHIKSHHG